MLLDDKYATLAHIIGRICDEIKQQPWKVVVYRSLERKMYCKYVNNQQREGPAVHDVINKISKQSTTWGSSGTRRDKQNSSSMIINKLHLSLCWLITKAQYFPVLLEEYVMKKTTTMNSRGLLVVRTKNVLWIWKEYKKWGYSVTRRDKQNSSSLIINELHLPLCWCITKTQRLPVLLAEYVMK